MRKKILIGTISALLLLILVFPTVFSDPGSDTAGVPQSTQAFDVTVENGQILQSEASAPAARLQFTIPEQKDYSLNLKYLPKGSSSVQEVLNASAGPGFLTICVITDEAGLPVYSIGGNVFSFDTQLALTPGIYFINFYCTPAEPDYRALAATYLCGSAWTEVFMENVDFTAVPKDGVWTMECTYEVIPEGSLTGEGVAMLFGILIGICLIIAILTLITKGDLKERFDERQELEKGKGFRYAYFTLLAYIVCIFCIDMTGLSLPVDISAAYMAGTFLSICVYAVYCIWHESYFALNQRKGVLMFFLAVIGAANLLIALVSIFEGSMFQNGRLTYHVTNLLCSILFLALFFTMLLKKLLSARKASDEDDIAG